MCALKRVSPVAGTLAPATRRRVPRAPLTGADIAQSSRRRPVADAGPSAQRPTPTTAPTRRILARGTAIENTAECEVDAPLAVCYEMRATPRARRTTLPTPPPPRRPENPSPPRAPRNPPPPRRPSSRWDDRESIPQWMPWIDSVTVLPEDDRLSRWVLRTTFADRVWQLAWVARNLAPVPGEKIHWRSVDADELRAAGVRARAGEGTTGGQRTGADAALEVPNRGGIRFAALGAERTRVALSITYEAPDALAFAGGALRPFVEGILRADMDRFAALAAERARAARG